MGEAKRRKAQDPNYGSKSKRLSADDMYNEMIDALPPMQKPDYGHIAYKNNGLDPSFSLYEKGVIYPCETQKGMPVVVYESIETDRTVTVLFSIEQAKEVFQFVPSSIREYQPTIHVVNKPDPDERFQTTLGMWKIPLIVTETNWDTLKKYMFHQLDSFQKQYKKAGCPDSKQFYNISITYFPEMGKFAASVFSEWVKLRDPMGEIMFSIGDDFMSSKVIASYG